MKVSELQALPSKILMYSPAGRGKTALFLTLGERAQLLDMDDNLDVAFGLDDRLRDDRLSVDVVQFIDRNPKKPTAFAAVKKFIYSIADQCHKGTYPFDVLGLDSLTSLAVASQDYVMGNANAVGKNPEIQHWGMLLNEIENIIKILRSLPINVFILAHETTFTSDDVNQIQIAIPGQKLPGRIVRMFSEIWYLRIRSLGGGKNEFYIQTAPTSSITCRSGRGLKSGFRFATSDKSGAAIDSVSLWTILDQIQRKDNVVKA